MEIVFIFQHVSKASGALPVRICVHVSALILNAIWQRVVKLVPPAGRVSYILHVL